MKVCVIPEALFSLLTAGRELTWTHGFTAQNMMQGVSGSISTEPDRQSIVKCNENLFQASKLDNSIAFNLVYHQLLSPICTY